MLRSLLRSLCSRRNVLVFALPLLWSIGSAQELRWFDPASIASKLVCTNDGSDLYASYAGEVRRWSLPSETYRRTYIDGANASACTVSPAGDRIALVEGRDVVCRSTETFAVLFDYSAQGDYLPRSAAFTKSGSFLMVLSGNGGYWRVEKLRTSDGTVAATYNFRQRYWSLTRIIVAPDESKFLAYGDSGLCVWRNSDSEPYIVSPGYSTCAAISTDGRLAATSSLLGGVSLLDLTSGSEIACVAPPGPSFLNALAFDPTSRNLLAGFSRANYHNHSGVVVAWDTMTHLPAYQFTTAGQVAAFAFPPSGATAYFEDSRGLWSFDRVTGSLVNRVAPAEYGYQSVSASSDGSFIVQNAQDISRIDSGTGRVAWSFLASGPGFAISPDDQTVAAGAGKNVLFIDAVTGLPQRSIVADGNAQCSVGAIAYSPDGRFLAFGKDVTVLDRSCILIYDLVAGRYVARLPVHYPAGQLKFTPDGQSLIAGVDQGELRIYAVNGWRQVASSMGGWNPAFCDLSADGALIAAAYRLQETYWVQILRASDLTPILTIPIDPSPRFARFSRDGSVIWVGRGNSDEHATAFSTSTGQRVFEGSENEVRGLSDVMLLPGRDSIGFVRWDGSVGVFKNPIR